MKEESVQNKSLGIKIKIELECVKKGFQTQKRLLHYLVT